MSNVTIDARLGSDGKSYLYGNNNKIVTEVEIKKNTDMVITIGSGFSNTAEISKFVLYPVLADGTKDSANPIGTWQRGNPTQEPTDYVSIAAATAGGVQVTDTDGHTNDGLFFFSITVADGGANYDSDPQLKVKKIAT